MTINIKNALCAIWIAVLLALVSPACLAAWAPPPPEEREPLDVISAMIYAAHGKDRDAVVDCVDIPGFYQEYLTRTHEDNPLSESAFRKGLLNALSGSYSAKLDDVLKGLQGREKYNFIKMFVKSYSDVREQGDYRRIIIRAGDEADEQPEIYVRRSSGAWRVVWVEPFDRLREMFGDTSPDTAAPPSSKTTKHAPQSVLDPDSANLDTLPALDLAPAKRAPSQVLAVLLIGADRSDWDMAISAFDIQGLRNNLVRDMPALDFVSTDKLKEVFTKVISRSSEKFSSFLPEELNKLKKDEKALMVELMVRALSQTDVSGTTARIKVQNPDDANKTYEYKMNKTADGWKIDVLSVFDNFLDKFMGQLNLY